MNRDKIIGIVLSIAVISVLAASLATQSIMAAPRQATGEYSFNVSGKNDCLRFLNETVSMVYVPFTVAANHQGQLTINCTKMPGGVNGYTDIYVYKGYWDNGTNHTCLSNQIYSILN
jgi:hypothetical protein